MAMTEHPRRLLPALFAATVAVCLAFGSVALAKPPHLDPTFGHNGRIIKRIGLPREVSEVSEGGVDLASELGGRGQFFVLAGTKVSRYRADGRPVRSFGTGGTISIDRTVEGIHFVLEGIAVDGEGRLIAFGQVERVLPTPKFDSEPYAGAFLRFNRDGRPDLSFGGGDGAEISSFGLDGLGPEVVERINGLAVDNTGRIVLSGSVGREAPGGPFPYCDWVTSGFVARLNPDGSLDSSFGEHGAHLLGGYESAEGVALDDSGHPLYYDRPWDCRTGGVFDRRVAVDRLALNGLGDPEFGSSGRAWLEGTRSPPTIPYGEEWPPDSPVAVAADGFGRVLLLRTWALQRLLANGAVDQSFGQQGIRRIPAHMLMEAGGLTDLAVTHNGGVVVTGSEPKIGGVEFLGNEPEFGKLELSMVLGRIGPKGMLDSRLGPRGVITIGHRNTQIEGLHIALDGGKRAIVAGLVRPFEGSDFPVKVVVWCFDL